MTRVGNSERARLLAQKQAAQEKEEPPQNSDFRQLIREMCGIKASAEQKQKTRRNDNLCRILKLIHKKSSIYLNNTSQISLVIAITPDLTTEEPEYSLSMRDEHLSTISKTESDEVIKSSVKNLVPIPSEFEVTSYNEKEFSGEVAHIDPILPRIEEADFDLEEEIRLVENLLYDNSSPQSPKELNAEVADTILESLSPYPIPVKDSDFYMEEIDLFLSTDDLMPQFIEHDDYDSEGDIYFLKEFISNDSLPFSKNESSNFDHHDDPSFPRSPPEPPDVEVFFEPDLGVLTTKVVKGISEHYVLMPNIFPTLPTLDPLYLVYDTLLPFSSKNKDKGFKPGILSYLLVSHRDKINSDFSENPMMMMYGGDIPLLDVLQPPGFDDPNFPDKIYKVEKALYGLHQAPRACKDKYVADILKKFDFSTVKTASTPMEPNKALVMDADAEDVDVNLNRSMNGSLMYLTASRPDITFTICTCARFQVTPKTSHLRAVKRLFRYLKDSLNWAFGILEIHHLTWKLMKNPTS
nr:hypothetical protein [Tanacetum cinerariifolium]